MPSFITQDELDEMDDLAARWESLNHEELGLFLALCHRAHEHSAEVERATGDVDYEINSDLDYLIGVIQERLEVSDICNESK